MTTEERLADYVDTHRDVLIGDLSALVRIPSENTPPVGAESACQSYCHGVLQACGFDAELYELSQVSGLESHPLYFPGRDYRGRPNVAARLRGTGGGRSLILSGHIDTVPRGAAAWTRDPFGAQIEDRRLYGRGSNDMKAGIAANLFAARAIHGLGLTLAGDLTIESVVDEEFGGVNGTLAGRVRGYLADAAIISEPTFLEICPAQRGGRVAHITFTIPNSGILDDAMEAGVADQLAWFLTRLPEFARLRRESAPAHPAYARMANPVPVSVLKISTGAWGATEPLTTAASCQLELYWQTMPGEDRSTIDRQFTGWLNETVAQRPGLFPAAPKIEFPLRWLPGASIPETAPLVREFAASVETALGIAPKIAGLRGPCDMYVFPDAFAIPALLWGVSGSNTHMPDEYVELDSLIAATKALLLFVYRWCMGPA
jgi:acetylornithine deacetylase